MNLSTSRAIILHPLVAPVGGALSPNSRAVAEWLRSLSPCDVPNVDKRPLSLLDFTCDENVHVVLSFLDGPSLCSARSVCRSWRHLSNDDALWLELCLHEFHVSPEQLKSQPESYQKLYQFACRSLKTLLRDYLHEQCLTNLQNSLRIPRAAAMTLIASRSSV
ncbi:F-box protein, putative [Phytophthora infestans T30-4]|uniref:F-box protein, putative n=2 Tax=Phytophthora infestans TaxID=4787 RepID=D0MQR8_PHYIT|nr:F-box protein, putative [Phytophthora infestans T30-4]EEY57837.1 F-box protein, putative [Phytophthora infestans T30-4]KAF4033360.1 F-box-like [Phytophthora infestans]KAF4133734.1 F-box-like [Phytophthora infestans]|eukprot:XP_002909023.1 F-box protein, putative [Phytophthora infestans T30-4]